MSASPASPPARPAAGSKGAGQLVARERDLPAGRVMREVLLQFVDAIVSGQFVPDTPLPGEAELMRQFGASRTTLRETMQRLTALGMLRARPRSGTMVLPRARWNMLDPVVLDAALRQEPDIEFFTALLDIRALIEPAAAAAAAQAGNLPALMAIGEALDRMAAASGRDAEAWSLADLDFHSAIIESSGNWVYAQLISAVRAALLAIFRLTNRGSQSHEEAIAMHRAVLEAIRLRDPAAAHAAMLAVVARGRVDLERALRAAAAGPAPGI
ncbi:FadR/GntR family transcriptional regulator [Frigidibacter sp. MR17.24]|uniref:FadR/GntR family transcriptional regulator n=1 Tax=Frigidibacter sp. MR17.24 TaxID=3127345 RepID=UPI003012DA13